LSLPRPEHETVRGVIFKSHLPASPDESLVNDQRGHEGHKRLRGGAGGPGEVA
jgi:hypothetical protein